MTNAKLGDAVAAHRAGDVARAESLYEEVLAAEPDQPDALHLRGLLAQQGGDFNYASRLIEKSLAVRPGFAQGHYNLAIVRTQERDFASAVRSYEAAIALAPNLAEAHSNLGNLYLQQGRREDALRAYESAIRAKPDFADVFCNLGIVLFDLLRFDEAIVAFESALQLVPELAEVHANLGQIYRRSGRFAQAIAASKRALQLRPGYLDGYWNLSLCAYAIDDFELALQAIRQLLERQPQSAEAYKHRARIYHAMGRYAEEIADSQAAITCRPDDVEAHVDLALALLVTGDITRGWDEYTWRSRLPGNAPWYAHLDHATLWNGDSFVGRRMLVTREQGFGDAIQVARYLPAVKARGGRVVLEVAPELVALFETLEGVDELRVVTGDVASLRHDIDLYVPLLNLPRACPTDRSSVPASIPYLYARQDRIERWQPRLIASTRKRIGIVWAGNPGHANDRRRSARLEDFADLGAIADISWFGLQKGREEDRRTCGALTLDPLGSEIVDFADTAAILSGLDLVIAVDTSIVHLAGAMGIPIWTLLPFVPDWRWLLDRSDSPWYPTMRLFRQPCAGDWPSVFADVARKLTTWIEAETTSNDRDRTLRRSRS